MTYATLLKELVSEVILCARDKVLEGMVNIEAIMTDNT